MDINHNGNDTIKRYASCESTNDLEDISAGTLQLFK